MNPEETRELIRSAGEFETTFLGATNSSLGVEEDICLSDEKRRTHVLSIGATGTGKTQLMVHAALQDAHKGHGLCVINPKGGMIDELLAKLPPSRYEDVIYINPGKEPVTSINVLQPYTHEEMNRAQKENQKEIIVSDLIDLFRRYSENWGDRFGRVLETLLRAYINLNLREQENESYTLIDVFEAVVNQEQLTQLIDQVHDQVIHEQLVRVKEDLGTYELEPLQRRLNDFVMNTTIRKVIGGESSINFRNAVQQGKIVLVDIQKGEVGGTVSELVGSIVITKIWAAAQSRVNQQFEDREPFYLYVDELKNFAGEGSNFTKILSEAREYRLGCWLTTQYLNQLATEMKRAAANDCRTKIVFNPDGTEDLNRIAGMLQGIDKKQLRQLGQYRAVIQKPSETQRGPATAFKTYPPWNANHAGIDQIKDRATQAEPGTSEIELRQSLGNQASAGGEKHKELLAKAKQELEEQGYQVNLLYQADEEEKPDGHVIMPDGETAHLEAEHSTLTKPAKVLKNLKRGTEKDREVIFVVEKGKAAKLENIVSDPVNRRGTEHEDEHGSYSYYKSDGEKVTEVEKLEQADYRIIEVHGDELTIHEEKVEIECPMLEDHQEEELEKFCLHRDDGHCRELGQECVLNHE